MTNFNDESKFRDFIKKTDWNQLEQNGILKKDEAENLFKLTKIDPGSTISKMRSIIERIIQFLYIKNIGPIIRSKNLIQMLKSLNSQQLFPKTIYIYFNTIRITGNEAVHGNTVSEKDVNALIPLFILIIEWFIENQLKNLQIFNSENNKENSQGNIEFYRNVGIYSEEAKALKKIERDYDLKILPWENDPKNRQDSFFKAKNGHVLHLDLTKQELTTIPVSVKNLKHLQILDIDKNKIRQIPDWFAELKNLKSISFLSNPIKKFPNVLKKISSLSEIYLNKSLLTARDTNDIKEKGIQIKYYKSGRFTTLGCSLVFIIILISYFSIEIESLSTIELFFLSIINIIIFMAWLSPFYLISYYFGGELIPKIIHFIGEKRFPKNFELIHDSEIQLLHELEMQYDISLKPISKIQCFFIDKPQCYYTIKNKMVETLCLNGINVPVLPDEIGKFTKIEEIIFRSNGFVTIPRWVDQLSELKVLDLKGNKSNSLPYEINDVPRLMEIRIPYREKNKGIYEVLKKKGIHIRIFSKILFVHLFFWLVTSLFIIQLFAIENFPIEISFIPILIIPVSIKLIEYFIFRHKMKKEKQNNYE